MNLLDYTVRSSRWQRDLIGTRRAWGGWERRRWKRGAREGWRGSWGYDGWVQHIWVEDVVGIRVDEVNASRLGHGEARRWNSCRKDGEGELGCEEVGKERVPEPNTLPLYTYANPTDGFAVMRRSLAERGRLAGKKHPWVETRLSARTAAVLPALIAPIVIAPHCQTPPRAQMDPLVPSTGVAKGRSISPVAHSNVFLYCKVRR
jgi:hypothetical protein